jgi:hypothetical protein
MPKASETFFGNLAAHLYHDDEITMFDASGPGYYAYLANGLRFDIIRVFGIQPPVADPLNFLYFMFVETNRGFYLFRQRVVEGTARDWCVFLELKPVEPFGFYEQAWELYLEKRKSADFPSWG